MNTKTIPNDKFLNGSRVLVRGKKFLAKQIIMHMWILAKYKGVKPLKYSHAEFLLWDERDQQLYTIGAREKGTEISKVQDYYKDHDFVILRPKKSLTKKETDAGWKYFEKVDPSGYQVWNFLSWITYLKTGWWLASAGDKKTYCYELAARMSNAVDRWDHRKQMDRISIYDIWEDKYYDVLRYSS